MNMRDYLVIDLEATCDDQGAVPRREMEIIEIGAVWVDGETLQARSEFQRFVRPVRHPELTEFCQQLTSITQAEVDAAATFPEVLAELREYAYSSRSRPVFGSWGNYDRHQFQQDARFHGVKLPFGTEHLNIKRAFSNAIGSRKRYGMAGALRRVGIPLEGTHHRGIDDARNIAKLLPYALARTPIPAATKITEAERKRDRRARGPHSR